MKTSDVLRKAGDVLRVGGWCRGDYENGHSHCIVGAVRAVDARDLDSLDLLGDILSDGRGGGAELRWNDRVCRSDREAQRLLDAAYIVALQIEGEDPADYEVL